MADLTIDSTVGGYLFPYYTEFYANIDKRQLVDGRLVIVANDIAHDNEMTIYQFMDGDLEYRGDNGIDVTNVGVTIDDNTYPDRSEVEYNKLGNVSTIINYYGATIWKTELTYSVDQLLTKATHELVNGKLEVIYFYDTNGVLTNTITQFKSNDESA